MPCHSADSPHPQAPAVSEAQAGKESIWKESRRIEVSYERPPLFGLLIIFFVLNINLGFVNVLRTPLVLARTGGDEVALGIVKSAVAAGGLAGGLVMIVWDGPKSKVRGIFAGMALVAISTIAMGLGHNVIVWAAAGGLTWMTLLIENSCSQAYWQSKVAPAVQGRVFAARSMLSGAAAPLAAVVAGPLADRVFEPQVSGGGFLGSAFGGIVGTGPGSGLSLMFLFSGILALVTAIIGYGVRPSGRVRRYCPIMRRRLLQSDTAVLLSMSYGIIRCDADGVEKGLRCSVRCHELQERRGGHRPRK